MGEILFEVENLHVTYRRPGQKAVEAVRGVSFELHAGETLGIVGESGSGKSTIAKTLMLLQPSSGGVARFRGKDIATFTSDERRQYRRDVQMVFQDAVGSLNPRMTIRQALEEILRKSMGGGQGRQSPRSLSPSPPPIPSTTAQPPPAPPTSHRPSPPTSRRSSPSSRSPPRRRIASAASKHGSPSTTPPTPPT